MGFKHYIFYGAQMKIFTIILFAFTLTACNYYPKTFYSVPFVKLDDINSYHHTYYRSSDIPAFVASGSAYNGKNIQLRIYDIDSGELVSNSQKVVIPTGRSYNFWFRELDAGRYRADLFVNNELDKTVNIIIEK